MNPDSKLSLQRLASVLGLAKSTVSMALRDHPRISATTRERVREAAQRLGYVQDADLATVMAHVQSRRPRDYQGNLAIIPIIRTRVSTREIEGCQRRATRLGYKVELVADYKRYRDLAKLLASRGVVGVIFIGWPWRSIPEDARALRRVCEQFPCSVVAARPNSPAVHAVMSDVFLSMRTAVASVLALGYRRPAALINPYLDDLQDQAYTGAFLAAQRQFPPADRIEPAYINATKAPFRPWLEATGADCVITHDNAFAAQLQSEGYRLPKDIGLVHLDLHAGLAGPKHSGMDQKHDLLGESAVDTVVAQLHRGERGVPSTQKCILIEASWVEGATTRATAKTTSRKKAAC